MRILLMSALFCVSALAHAGASDQLKAFVSEVKSATGSFSQYTVGTQGQPRPRQSGQFAFERPGRFKWVVQQPYEQSIVSDGKQLFQFDPDLNQVTVRQVDEAIGTSPAAILFGSGSLEQAFDVSELPDRDGLQWLRAKPRGADAGFAQVDIGLKGNQPVRVELLDAFGQTTRVEITGISPNPSLPQDEFRFVPPAGADVVQM
ncbi:outer membrane lipoprotein chaperone LolA [Orrella sp. JC864]|uniref:outer membrane lipoprotein chaperone LolA n=1 Tax=Orrella sp. JC864 TaxID=3120298 RepID=UPI00300A43AC